ncbi:hypothetical protein JMJ77_0007392, partial [Colletotrichum scovillei]
MFHFGTRRCDSAVLTQPKPRATTNWRQRRLEEPNNATRRGGGNGRSHRPNSSRGGPVIYDFWVPATRNKNAGLS